MNTFTEKTQEAAAELHRDYRAAHKALDGRAHDHGFGKCSAKDYFLRRAESKEVGNALEPLPALAHSCFLGNKPIVSISGCAIESVYPVPPPIEWVETLLAILAKEPTPVSRPLHEQAIPILDAAGPGPYICPDCRTLYAFYHPACK